MHPTLLKSGVSLRQLLKIAEFVGADDINVQSCCGEWHSCQPGDVFVARETEDHDGT